MKLKCRLGFHKWKLVVLDNSKLFKVCWHCYTGQHKSSLYAPNEVKTVLIKQGYSLASLEKKKTAQELIQGNKP